MYNSYIFVKLIFKYFIFAAIVNRIVFLFLFLGYLLLVYRNTADLGIFVLYPANFLN